MNSIEVLEGALALIERPGGWWQAGRGGNYCALTAIGQLGSDGQGELRDCGMEAAFALQVVVGPGIPVWNDDPSRTLDEVRDAFRTAIRNEKARLGIPLEVPAERVPA